MYIDCIPFTPGSKNKRWFVKDGDLTIGTIQQVDKKFIARHDSTLLGERTTKKHAIELIIKYRLQTEEIPNW